MERDFIVGISDFPMGKPDTPIRGRLSSAPGNLLANRAARPGGIARIRTPPAAIPPIVRGVFMGFTFRRVRERSQRRMVGIYYQYPSAAPPMRPSRAPLSTSRAFSPIYGL